MELLSIKFLRKSGRKIVSTYALTDEMNNYYGAYAYLNVAKTVNNDPRCIVIEGNKTVINADDFNPIRYGAAK